VLAEDEGSGDEGEDAEEEGDEDGGDHGEGRSSTRTRGPRSAGVTGWANSTM
jgi:hypothetical protein